MPRNLNRLKIQTRGSIVIKYLKSLLFSKLPPFLFWYLSSSDTEHELLLRRDTSNHLQKASRKLKMLGMAISLETAHEWSFCWENKSGKIISIFSRRHTPIFISFNPRDLGIWTNQRCTILCTSCTQVRCLGVSSQPSLTFLVFFLQALTQGIFSTTQAMKGYLCSILVTKDLPSLLKILPTLPYHLG